MRFRFVLAGALSLALVGGGAAHQAQAAAPSYDITSPEFAPAQARINALAPLMKTIGETFGQVNAKLLLRAKDGKLTPQEVKAEIAPVHAAAARSLAQMEALQPLPGSTDYTRMANQFTATSRESGRQIVGLLKVLDTMWEARFRGDQSVFAREQAKLQSGAVTLSLQQAASLRANKVFFPADDAMRELFEGMATLADAEGQMASARGGLMAPKAAARALRTSKATLEASVETGRVKLKAERAEGVSLGFPTDDLDAEDRVFLTLRNAAPLLDQVAARLDGGDTTTLRADMQALRVLFGALQSRLAEMAG